MRSSWLSLLAGGLGLVSALSPPEVLVISEFANSRENQGATNAKYSITTKTQQQFMSLTAEDLSVYNAVVIGDIGSCDIDSLAFITPSVIGALKGNIFIQGTSPYNNYIDQSATTSGKNSMDILVRDALKYVTGGPATGLYLSLSCYYRGYSLINPQSVSVLSGFGTFSASSAGSAGTCASDVYLANPVILPDLNSEKLGADQACAIAETFKSRPPSFSVAAAERVNSAQGDPYLLYRGATGTNCGNSIVEANFGEVCDDGLDNGKAYTNCDINCQCQTTLDTNNKCPVPPNVCGNGIYDPDATVNPNEQCDAGPKGDTMKYCKSDCTCETAPNPDKPGTCFSPSSCGNSIREYDEECDSGVSGGNSVCSGTCKCIAGYDKDLRQCTPVCGNSVKEAGEKCDPGQDNDLCVSCQCRYGIDENGDCAPNRCKDGVVAGDEECEPVPPIKRRLELELFGRKSDQWDINCDKNCKCLYGKDPNNPGHCLEEPRCGDGSINGQEECEPIQGNGKRGLVGRTDLQPDSTCSAKCTCIYGVDTVHGGCKAVPYCGDGEVNSATEQCEPVQPNNPKRWLLSREPNPIVGDDVCTAKCQCIYGVDPKTAGKCIAKPVCGDGTKNAAEQCDGGAGAKTGEALVTDTCSAACTCIYDVNTSTGECNPKPDTPPNCGNSAIDDGEECEVSLAGADLCSPVCSCIYGVKDASAHTCLPKPACLNGEIEKGEECEPKMVTRMRRETIGGDDLCNDVCQCIYGLKTDGSGCNSAPVCGDNIKEGNEECDEGKDGNDICSPACTCIYGVSPSGYCSSVPSSSEPATTRPTSTPGSTSSRPTSSPTSSQASVPTTTDGPFPPVLGDFSFVGCTGSEQSYPSFFFQTSNANMTLEFCTEACSAHAYAGVHVTNCYCADTYDAIVEVARDLCSVPCPGNPAENCGGYRQLARRADVPAVALLAIYQNDPVVATATGPAPTNPTSTTSLPPLTGNPQSTATALVTATETAVATATATTTAAACVNGWCHSGGYVFEQCQGFPNPGELVFILAPCSCHGGWQYVEAGCDGAACGSQVVYRCVEYNGSNAGNGTVYQPQACTDCSGGVTFVQPSPAPAPAPSTVTGTMGQTTGTPVVVAGAGKVATFFSSLVIVVGAFALLM